MRPVLLLSLSLVACADAAPPRPIPPLTTAIPPMPLAVAQREAAPSPFGYPPTRRGDATETLFGKAVADPYRWLEDATTDETKSWMLAQNAFARDRLAKLPNRDAFAQRLRELFYVDSMGVPSHRGDRFFWSHRGKANEKTIVYWKEGKAGAEKVLLDPNTWSADGSVALGGWWPTHDGKTVAYKTKQNNSDEATLHVMDVALGKKSAIDVIEGAKYAAPAWTPKGDGFYYTWLPTDPKIPTTERPGFAEIRFHRLGQDPAKDAVVRGRTNDPKAFLSSSISWDGHFLLVYVSHGWTRSDVYFADLRKGLALRPLAVDIDAEFDVDAFGDVFYVRTNDGAPRYRVFKVDPKTPERSAWKEIVAERPDAMMSSSGIVGGKLTLTYLKDVVSHLEVRGFDGALVREVALPAIGTASGLYGREDEDLAYFSFNSFTYPTEIYETSVKTGAQSLWFKMKLPIRPDDFVVEQRFATSLDGTRVPMFVVRKKGEKAISPLILYGYGGFQGIEAPSFRASIYPWLEHGGTYVVANLRGGSEFGEEWHRAGMKTKKQNVFDDFVAVAAELVKEGYTRPESLVIQGGSNGGLLVGAALTQRPDLFRVALCEVPLLDMVRFHKFGSGKTWVEEYGSPDDEKEFAALHAYSPYHRVRAGSKYPSVLVLSADSDDRVDPMHARKFAAALQGASTGGIVLLRIEHNAGHGGPDMVKAWVEKLADEYAFAFAEIGRD